MHIKFRLPSPRIVRAAVCGSLCVTASFMLGIQSVGEVHPIGSLDASGIELRGDMDGNDIVDFTDVRRILDIIESRREADEQELLADPTGDGRLTVEDAIAILHELP